MPALLQTNEGEAAVSQILSYLPFGTFLSLFYFLLIAVFLASHLDAAAITLTALPGLGLELDDDFIKEYRVKDFHFNQ